MFIVRSLDGKTYSEGKEFTNLKGEKKFFSWDDIPKNIKISLIQILYPFPVKFKNPDGKTTYTETPKLSMKGYSRYFFFNEAKVDLKVQAEKVIGQGVPTLEAKSVAGIDDQNGVITTMRMDKWGNCNISKTTLKQLEKSIKSGLFRGEIIRDGA